MLAYVSTINSLVAIGGIVVQFLAAAFLLVYIFAKDNDFAHTLARIGVPIAFVLTLGATALTLFYSEVLGFQPCGLCWLQRVFMFPQVVILGIALWKKHHVADYIIGLSALGAVIALYQHYLQLGGAELVTCPAVSTGADCAERILFAFGYMTFPLLSFSLFAFLIVLMLFVRRGAVLSSG